MHGQTPSFLLLIFFSINFIYLNYFESILISGAIIPTAYESSIQAMIQLSDVLSEEVVGGPNGIAIFVTHTLPYLATNFDAPNSLCINVANAIAAVCFE